MVRHLPFKDQTRLLSTSEVRKRPPEDPVQLLVAQSDPVNTKRSLFSLVGCCLVCTDSGHPVATGNLDLVLAHPELHVPRRRWRCRVVLTVHTVALARMDATVYAGARNLTERPEVQAHVELVK